jgi:hypothetical protein
MGFVKGKVIEIPLKNNENDVTDKYSSTNKV